MPGRAVTDEGTGRKVERLEKELLLGDRRLSAERVQHDRPDTLEGTLLGVSWVCLLDRLLHSPGVVGREPTVVLSAELKEAVRTLLELEDTDSLPDPREKLREKLTVVGATENVGTEVEPQLVPGPPAPQASRPCLGDVGLLVAGNAFQAGVE